jgi:hypothetical protein
LRLMTFRRGLLLCLVWTRTWAVYRRCLFQCNLLHSFDNRGYSLNLLDQIVRPHRLHKGHCSRCDTTLDQAYMVASLDRCTGRNVPVCLACLTADEAAQITASRTCKACGLPMHGSSRWSSHFCSAGCQQRVTRAARSKMASRVCLECGTKFVGRSHAMYCSPKCKVRWFRRSQKSS